MAKYTGNSDTDLKVLLPEVVAASVAETESMQAYLLQRFKIVYAHNETWGKQIARESTKSRDMLYSFMEHWKAGKVKWDRLAGIRYSNRPAFMRSKAKRV